LRGIAQTAPPVGLHYGFIHSCHRSANYETYESTVANTYARRFGPRLRFNGLHNAVANQLQEDPKSGAIFAFTNKRRSLLKILNWDGTGLWVHAKDWNEEPSRGPSLPM
ncbi:MAG: IS66 family insertion sequence element accessory protein TnpB, partial [Luteolibacter sp.]|nr:IS66 family insertion sequence element accessory protein TnpB [Luteolibacter sp.]